VADLGAYYTTVLHGSDAATRGRPVRLIHNTPQCSARSIPLPDRHPTVTDILKAITAHEAEHRRTSRAMDAAANDDFGEFITALFPPTRCPECGVIHSPEQERALGLVCNRCGRHTGNSSQGHYWSLCKVAKKDIGMHFCCPDDCELGGKPG
jgi:hypothetical protein